LKKGDNMAFDKLKFWKKEEDSVPEEMPLPTEDTFAPRLEQEQPSFVESFKDLHQTQSSGNMERDVQLILSKLDTIRATLENINHRLENLERIAQSE